MLHPRAERSKPLPLYWYVLHADLIHQSLTPWQGDLDINQKPGSPQRSRGPPNGAPRGDRMPPPPHMRRPPGHKRTPSEEEKRRRALAKMREAKAELDIFADPTEKKSRSHRRRNSESSIRDKSSLDPEEEKKRRERKHRDGSKRGVRGQKRLDVIDKLDGTSIYGSGCKLYNYHSINLLTGYSVPP